MASTFRSPSLPPGDGWIQSTGTQEGILEWVRLARSSRAPSTMMPASSRALGSLGPPTVPQLRAHGEVTALRPPALGPRPVPSGSSGSRLPPHHLSSAAPPLCHPLPLPGAPPGPAPAVFPLTIHSITPRTENVTSRGQRDVAAVITQRILRWALLGGPVDPYRRKVGGPDACSQWQPQLGRQEGRTEEQGPGKGRKWSPRGIQEGPALPTLRL